MQPQGHEERVLLRAPYITSSVNLNQRRQTPPAPTRLSFKHADPPRAPRTHPRRCNRNHGLPGSPRTAELTTMLMTVACGSTGAAARDVRFGTWRPHLLPARSSERLGPIVRIERLPESRDERLHLGKVLALPPVEWDARILRPPDSQVAWAAGRVGSRPRGQQVA